MLGEVEGLRLWADKVENGTERDIFLGVAGALCVEVQAQGTGMKRGGGYSIFCVA